VLLRSVHGDAGIAGQELRIRDASLREATWKERDDEALPDSPTATSRDVHDFERWTLVSYAGRGW